jgi:hypothetical protein
MKNSQTVESSVPEVEETQEQSSSTARDEQTSHPDHDAETSQSNHPPREEIPAELLDLVSKEIERRFQSAKDKRWAQLEKQYGELHELSQQKDSPLPQAASISSDLPIETQLMERAQSLLKRLGLRNSPETAALLRDQDAFDGPGGYLDLVDKVIGVILPEEGSRELPIPSPAGVVTYGGGSAASADLAAVYQHRKKKIRPGDVNSLMALKREFREKGLNIF